MSTNQKPQNSFLDYDLFKLSVALVLAIILILLLLRGCSSSSVSADITQEASGTPAETTRPAETASTKIPDMTPRITAPEDGDTVEGDTITLAGTGQPGTDLHILDGGKEIGTVTTTEEGKWIFQAPVEAGQHTFVAVSSDGSAKSEPVSVTVGPARPTSTSAPSQTPAPTAIPPTATPAVASGGAGCDGLISGYLLDEEHYVVGSCDTLSGIAAWLDVSVESLLESNPQITDPDTIIPGQIVNVPPE